MNASSTNPDSGAGNSASNSAGSKKYTCETITWIHAVTPKLFRFRTTRPAHFRFIPGQWARLGVEKKSTINESTSSTTSTQCVWRAYSIASASYDEHLEFYSIVVPDGEFTSELAKLAVGDTVRVEKQPYGFLTTARFQTTPQDVAGHDLWLLSTGTGLAPFISVLHDLEVWQNYEHIIVVHGVRQADELAYASEITALKTHELFAQWVDKRAQKLIYQACVSRETVPSTLQARIPNLIQSGELERRVGVALDPVRSRVMVCGNPHMVDDTRSVLKTRGLRVSRNAAPGQIAVENYW